MNGRLHVSHCRFTRNPFTVFLDGILSTSKNKHAIIISGIYLFMYFYLSNDFNSGAY